MHFLLLILSLDYCSFMALNSLVCADVPLRNCHSLLSNINFNKIQDSHV